MVFVELVVVHGFQVAVIDVGVEPHVKHGIGTVHGVEFQTRIHRFSHIDRIGVGDQAAIEVVVSGHGNAGYVAGLGLEVEGNTNGAVLLPIFLPASLQRVGQDGFEVGIATAEGVFTKLSPVIAAESSAERSENAFRERSKEKP